MKEQELLTLMLPDGMLEYFDISNADKQSDSYTIYLEEKNIIPQAYQSNKLQSKGFHDAITIQDFPLRGKACFLKVKRRRWLNLDTGVVVSRDWDVIAKGTRMTVEFAAFLKELNRYYSSKHS